jgi:hypothetical protein
VKTNNKKGPSRHEKAGEWERLRCIGRGRRKQEMRGRKVKREGKEYGQRDKGTKIKI